MPRDWMYTKDGDYGDGVAMFAARRRFAGSLPLPDGRPRSFAESFEWSAAASAECSHGKFGGAQLHGGAPKNQGDSAPLGERELTKLVYSVLVRWSKRQYSEQEEWQIYELRK